MRQFANCHISVQHVTEVTLHRSLQHGVQLAAYIAWWVSHTKTLLLLISVDLVNVDWDIAPNTWVKIKMLLGNT